MSIEQIIFNLLNKNAHTWVRYWQQKEMSGLTMYGGINEMRKTCITSEMRIASD